MWDLAIKTSRDAREFASLHALEFNGDAAPGLPPSASSHPFAGQRRRQCVSGEWRGREVQRFSTSAITVELMTLAGVLPRLQVVASGSEREALAVGGRVVRTGDPVFDSRWTVVTDDSSFASAFLNVGVREALLHPAAAGRALVVDGAALYLWAPGARPWSEARVRFEFLSVIRGRLDEDLWERFDMTPKEPSLPADAVWTPREEFSEVNQWAYAPVVAADGESLGDTGEFEVSLLNAQLEGAAFLPGPDDSERIYNSWRVAPEVCA